MYLYINNKYTQNTDIYYANKNFILYSINRLTALIYLILLFNKLIYLFRVLMKVYNILWLKFLNFRVKNTLFISVFNKLFFFVHVALNANELC